MDDIMKRILVMALVACFVLGAAIANAADMNFSGSFEHTLEWTDNTNFQDSNADDGNENDFLATQRVRLYFTSQAGETLKAVLGFEIDTPWGSPYDSINEKLITTTKGTGGGALGGDGTTVEVKHAYTDFMTGPVTWRVGLQGLAWPSAVAGSPIFNGDLTGIVASYAFNENVSVVTGWARLYDDRSNNLVTEKMNQEIDAATVIMPITMDGFTVTPYMIYAMAGKDVAANVEDMTNETGAVLPLTDDLTAFWMGGAFEVTAFDPITFGMDLIYGSVNGDEADDNDRSGWYWAGIATYKMDMVTPSLAFMYGSGEDEDDTNGSETMPTLAMGGGANSGLGLTQFGMNGNGGTETGDLLNDGRTDFMAVALILDDISFMENLKHKFVLVYGKGTSDKKQANGGVMVTEEDSFWEVNLDTSYAIYENLALNVNMAYLDVDRDSNWTAATRDLDAASKLYVNLTYKF
jgi:hypothetical protein